MKVPKKVKIGCYDFTVNWEDKPIQDNDLCCGIMSLNNHSITLSSSMLADKIPETFLHEIIHAIDDMYNLELGENRVNVLGIQLYQVIKDNKLSFLN